MAIKKLKTSDGVKLQDTVTGKLAGSEGPGKTKIPTPVVTQDIALLGSYTQEASSQIQAKYDLMKSAVAERERDFLNLAPEDFVDYFNKHWRDQHSHTASFNYFTIEGVSRYWALEFNAEHDMGIYVGRKDDGELFSIFGYGIHDVVSSNPIVLKLNLQVSHPFELTKEGLAHAFFELDENGDEKTRDERCAEYWSYISKDLGLTLLGSEDDKEVLHNLEVQKFVQEFNRRWDWPPPAPHHLAFNLFPIQGVKKWWAVDFLSEHGQGIYIGQKDDGECFLAYGDRIYSVPAYDTYVLDFTEAHKVDLTKEQFAEALLELDGFNGYKGSRDERCSTIWNHIAQELELEKDQAV